MKFSMKTKSILINLIAGLLVIAISPRLYAQESKEASQPLPTTLAFIAGVVGKGSTYLGAYGDDDGVWLDGSNSYKLRVEPNAPAAQFWSVTTYDMKTRANIQNGKENRYEINTYTSGLVKNKDGAIDIYFGPEAPKGHESNWIKTVEDENWFSYFRLYAPTEAYFDRSYKLNNIQTIK